MIGWESSWVPAGPAREHVLALRAAGIGSRRLAVLAGICRSQISVLVGGRPHRGMGPSVRIAADTAARILAVEIPDTTSPPTKQAAGALVSAVGAVRRLRALTAAGWPRYVLCERLGVTASNGARLWRDTTATVTAAKARAVAVLYDELAMQPGPSARARNEGAAKGWPMPLDYDDDQLDDPDAVIIRSGSRAVRQPALDADERAERDQQIIRYTDAGWSAARIAEHLGITARTVTRARVRAASRVEETP